MVGVWGGSGDIGTGYGVDTAAGGIGAGMVGSQVGGIFFRLGFLGRAEPFEVSVHLKKICFNININQNMITTEN